jgi:hypothetical protein
MARSLWGHPEHHFRRSMVSLETLLPEILGPPFLKKDRSTKRNPFIEKDEFF